MKQQRLSLYNIDIKYIRKLARIDDNVLSVSPQIGKSSRPFVGVVVICDDKQYCIPLSSPKPKHDTMKNQIDFMKIVDNGKIIGVLNFNNMIPINEQCIHKLKLKINKSDLPEDKAYKKLAIKQIEFCQKNQTAIVSKANKLYNVIVSGRANHSLKKRCCDFCRLEAAVLKVPHFRYAQVTAEQLDELKRNSIEFETRKTAEGIIIKYAEHDDMTVKAVLNDFNQTKNQIMRK